MLTLNLDDVLMRSLRVWRAGFLVAGACAGLMILQDVLYGGVDRAPFSIAAAQYLLPWFTWALLAPVLLYLFERFPIELTQPWSALLTHAAAGILVVGVKLLLAAPLAAWLIWQPQGVPFRDGVAWLLANRAGSNLLIFWALLCAYTAYRTYYSTKTSDAVTGDHPPLARIPVRAGAATAFVSLADVTYIESAHGQSVVFAGADRHLARATLQELERRLPREHFLRVHRSYIINVNQVQRIEPWGRGDYLIVLGNGERVVSGKTYRAAVKRLLDICPG